MNRKQAKPSRQHLLMLYLELLDGASRWPSANMKKIVHIVGNFSMITTDPHHVTRRQKTTEQISRANDRAEFSSASGRSEKEVQVKIQSI
jgi:hypothetical protein